MIPNERNRKSAFALEIAPVLHCRYTFDKCNLLEQCVLYTDHWNKGITLERVLRGIHHDQGHLYISLTERYRPLILSLAGHSTHI